ncbi:MAG: hypothetical protein ACR2H3_01460 [Acidimicrobiales bacterium]
MPLRLLRVVSALALVAVALVPGNASAQSPPPPAISISPQYGVAGSSGTWTIQVSGTGFQPSRKDGRISFQDDATTWPFATSSTGAFGPVSITTARRGAGSYLVTAAQPNTCGLRANCGAIARTTFSSIDGRVTDEATGRTDCGPAGKPFSLRVEGAGFPQSTSSGR